MAAKQSGAVTRLGFPHLDAEHPGEWVCPFQINGLKDDRARLAHSNDGLQSLTIASNFIRTSLDRLDDVNPDDAPHWAAFRDGRLSAMEPRFIGAFKMLKSERRIGRFSRRRLARKKSK